MNSEEIKHTVIQCFQDDGFIAQLQEKLLAPIVNRHVTEAVRARDQEIESLRTQLTATRDELDSLEQYSRRNTLTISGLPETQRENTDALVIDLARAAGVKVTEADLDRSHRVGQFKRDKPRQIIAKFVSFNKRQELLEARRNLRAGRVQRHPTLTERVLAQTFIAENLTKRNQLILFVARQLRRKGKIHSAWTNNCQIKIRTREGGPTIKISSLINLRDVVGEDPDLQRALQQNEDTATPAPIAGSAAASPAAMRAPGVGAASAAPAAAPASPGAGDSAGCVSGAGSSAAPTSSGSRAAAPGPLGAEAGDTPTLSAADVTPPEPDSEPGPASGAEEPSPAVEHASASSAAGATGPVLAVEAAVVSGTCPVPEAETVPASPSAGSPVARSTGDSLPATPTNSGKGTGGKRGKKSGRQLRNK